MRNLVFFSAALLLASCNAEEEGRCGAGEAWDDFGERCRKVLEDECLRQNAPDRGNREQAFAYQTFVLDFLLLSGDDASCRELIGAGAQGVVTVTGNVAPRLMHAMVEAALAGDLEVARELDLRLASLHTALFVESNPIPVKAAVALLGFAVGDVRLPLLNASQSTVDELRERLSELDLLKGA